MKILKFSLLAFLILGAPAAQACDFCQQRVNLSETVARCYLALYEIEIRKMRESGLPAQLINLTVCEGVEGVTRGSASVPIPTGQKIEITKSFLMDEDGLICLAKDLRSVSWANESNKELVRTFEVKRDCS